MKFQYLFYAFQFAPAGTGVCSPVFGAGYKPLKFMIFAARRPGADILFSGSENVSFSPLNGCQ
jgi:hypothetical protein